MKIIKQEIAEFFKSINLFLLIVGVGLEIMGGFFSIGEASLVYESFNLKLIGNIVQYTGMFLVIASLIPYFLNLYARYKKISKG